MKVFLVTVALCLIVATGTGVYYFLVYIPKQKEQSIQRQEAEKVTQIRDRCIKEYEEHYQYLYSLAEKIIKSSCYLGEFCTYQEFVSIEKNKNKNWVDPLSQGYQQDFMAKCITKYFPL